MSRSSRRSSPPVTRSLSRFIWVVALVACGEVEPPIDAAMDDMRVGDGGHDGAVDYGVVDDGAVVDSSRPIDDCRFDIESALPATDTLLAQVIEAATFAPNRTGDPAHEAYTDWIVEQLSAIEGLPDDAVRIIEHPDQALRTLTDRPTLTVTLVDGSTQRIAVPEAIPRAGLTGPDGITAPLLLVPQGHRPSPAEVRGRILVREAIGGALPIDELSAFALGVIDRDGTLDAVLTPGAQLERIWLRGSIPGDLLAAEQAGAAGVIFIRPFADETIEGLWVQTALSPIPAIQLGRTSGAALLDALQAPGEAQATLTVTGLDEVVTARSVRVDLPGGDPERVVFVSHTDTLNAVQENGGVSLLALARAFAAVPVHCRARTVRFEFVAGHRAGLVGSRAARAALEAERHPAVVVGLEHVGSLEYAPVDGPDGPIFEPTGQSELLALSLPHAELAPMVVASAERRDLDRVLMLESRGGVFGEAKAFADHIDTIELIAGPWIQNSANVGIEALDVGRMRRALAVVADLGVELMNAPNGSMLFTDLADGPDATGTTMLDGDCQRGTQPDLPGQRCVRIRTTCAGSSADGELRITPGPEGGRGVIMLGSGSLGRDFFAGVDRPASREALGPAIALVGRLRDAGYTVIERAWDAEAGWFGGEGGWRTRSCHLAALYAEVATWFEAPICGVGFSAGGIELAYAMAWHDVDALLDHAVLGGGPAGAPDALCAGTTDCAGAHAAYPSSCTPEELTCAAGQLPLAIDASHGGGRLCRDLAGPDDPGRATLEADRLDRAPDGLRLDVPVDLIWGAEDCLTIAAQGRLVADALRAAGTSVTTAVVPGVPHELPQHQAGVDTLFGLLDTRCGAVP